MIYETKNYLKILGSYDEYCFDEVLQLLPKSRRILICTYGMPLWWQGSPFDQLLATPSTTEILLVINIPEYSTNRDKQLRSLKSFCKRAKHVKVIYCPKSHAKFIVADDAVFLGSANFSSGTKSNFECGLFVRDNQLAESIWTWVSEEIIPNSSLSTDAIEKAAELQFWSADFETLLQNIDSGWASSETKEANELCGRIIEALELVPDKSAEVMAVIEAARKLVELLDEHDPELPCDSADSELGSRILSWKIAASPEDQTDLFAESAAEEAEEIQSIRRSLDDSIATLVVVLRQAMLASLHCVK